MNAKVLLSIVAVLYASVSSVQAKPGTPPSQPPAQPPAITAPAIPGLGPLEKKLEAKADAVVGQTEKAVAAKRDEAAAAQAKQDAKNAWDKAKNDVPLPGQSRDVKEITRLKAIFDEKQDDLSNKTQAAANAENARRSAVTNLTEFGQQNPTVKLPPSHPLIKKIDDLNKANNTIPALQLPDLTKNFAFRQLSAQNAAGTSEPGRVFDNPGGGGKPPVDLRPDRSKEPLPPSTSPMPATGQSGVVVAPQPQANALLDQERKALDTEAEALKTGAGQIVTWRTNLEGKIENLNGRIATHKRNMPDPFNQSAVNIYNATVDRLNKERDELIAEEKRFDTARLELINRALRFEDRVKKFGK